MSQNVQVSLSYTYNLVKMVWSYLVNVIRESSANVDLVVKRLLSPESEHAHLPVIFALEETRSSDVPNLFLPGFVFTAVNFGSPYSVCQTVLG